MNTPHVVVAEGMATAGLVGFVAMLAAGAYALHETDPTYNARRGRHAAAPAAGSPMARLRRAVAAVHATLTYTTGLGGTGADTAPQTPNVAVPAVVHTLPAVRLAPTRRPSPVPRPRPSPVPRPRVAAEDTIPMPAWPAIDPDAETARARHALRQDTAPPVELLEQVLNGLRRLDPIHEHAG